MSTAEDSLIERARVLAAQAHAGQQYGAQPYTVHLAEAVAVLARFGVADAEVVAATWLHDALEDTPLTRDEIVATAGARVAAMVAAVSDGPGQNRRERKEQPYRLIPQTPGAVLVKLADRIANVESAAAGRPELLAMYRKEYPVFQQRLRDPEDAVAAPLWARLAALLG